MVIESRGIEVDNYYIPPFKLKSGEIVVIHLYGGAHYYDLKSKLINVFTGKIENTQITIFKPLTFVKNFQESTFRRLFHPVTIGEYLDRKANIKSDFASKMFTTNQLLKKTKINTLTNTQKKLLCLYSTLSHTTDIIFDLDGQDPQGALEIYSVVKDAVKNGGSAILLDWTDDMKHDCGTFITLEWKTKTHRAVTPDIKP